MELKFNPEAKVKVKNSYNRGDPEQYIGMTGTIESYTGNGTEVEGVGYLVLMDQVNLGRCFFFENELEGI